MKRLKYIVFVLTVFLLVSCEQEITIDLPEYEPKLVVEGYIESGSYPFVTLSKSISYFEPIDTNVISNMYIGGDEATVIVSGAEGVDTLQYLNYGNYKFFVILSFIYFSNPFIRFT